MKTKIKNQKLALSKQTIAALSNLKMNKIKGGSNSCDCSEAMNDCTLPTYPQTGFILK